MCEPGSPEALGLRAAWTERPPTLGWSRLRVNVGEGPRRQASHRLSLTDSTGVAERASHPRTQSEEKMSMTTRPRRAETVGGRN